MSVWGALAGLSALFWAMQLVLALRCRAHIPTTASLPREVRERWPRLAMIVPARDEEAEIEAALRSKLGCVYPRLELVAVDDRSADGTGAVMDRLAATDPRVRVVHVAELPAGWLGKLHAMDRGLSATDAEWLLFSDADVFLEGDVLERVLAYAEREQVDLVAVMPGLDHESALLDGVMVDFVRAITLLGRMWQANADGSGIGIGVGAFNLVRRSALERTPGLAALKLDVADDMALGAMVKASGGRTRLFAGRGDVHLRFYASLGAVARSWEKFGTVFEFSVWRPTLFFGAQLALELGLPFAGLAHGGLAAVLGGAALAAGSATHAVLAAHLGLRWRGVLLWPLGLVLAHALLLRAAVVTARAQGLSWRGTFYGGRDLLAGRRFYAGRIDLAGD